MDDFKETTLKGHIQLCELRYKALEGKIDEIERRLTKVEAEISALKKEMATGFGEIKLLIEKQNSAKTTQMTATIGTVIVAVITVIGYIFSH
jgi:predicted  nucleic acid-binding Zn-ribbon protein